MFITTRTVSLFTSIVAAIFLWAGAALAVDVTADARPDYRRLNFGFTTAATMKMKREGTTVTLNFSKPVDASSASIKSKLGAYVTAVTTSSDKRTIIITLKNPGRVRQFANGKTLGIDIVGPPPTDAPPPENKTQAKPADASPPSATMPFKRAEVIKPVSGPVSKSVPIPDVETTDAPAPVAATSAKKNQGTKEFVVTTQKTKDGTVLNFPWPSRVAAAVFERPRAIWIVFSHEANIRAELLSTVMPKEVVRVQQYAYPGAMILRLTTDGSIHPVTSQSGSNYEWNVTLAEAPVKPALDTPINVEVTQEKRHLLLDVYDVGQPIAFYDPVINDRIVVVPTFETSRGIEHPRNYPDFSILATQQGLTLTSLRDDIAAEATRKGVKVSALHSLAISESLPLASKNAPPIPGASAASNVLMPYDQWYVSPKDFKIERMKRLQDIANANTDGAPAAMMQMVSLYLGQGFAQEALAYLTLIKQSHPDYYARNKLGVLSAASKAHLGRLTEAASDIHAKELDGVKEAQLWREFIAFVLPTALDTGSSVEAKVFQPPDTAEPPPPPPQPTSTGTEDNPTPPMVTAVAPLKPFDWLGYNKQFIRFYPPRIRQRMALLMSDAYTLKNREEDALKMFDTLAVDGTLDPIRADAEVMVGVIATKKKKFDEAEAIFQRLSNDHQNPHAQTAAKFGAIMARYANGKADATTTADQLESLRLFWHGDRLAHAILIKLSQVYKDNKEYASALRTSKYLLEEFPNDPEYAKISNEMSDLFDELFLRGQADTISPLKSLALFYEFRDLTPLGEKGDAMIQNLANRLASVDLLDRAAQLLENQIKYRVSGEARSRVGAELALLYLLNQQPNEAMTAIQITNFATTDVSLQQKRAQITAKALSSLDKKNEAIGILARDKTRDGNLLRLEILWDSKDWPNVINQAEDILAARPNLTAPLDMRETEVLLKLVLSYNFQGEQTQLKYLRDYYSGLLADGPYKQIFDYLTNDTNPLDTADFALVAQQISRTESFMNDFKEKIAQGKLSEIMQ
jgi:hypothetical protein